MYVFGVLSFPTEVGNGKLKLFGNYSDFILPLHKKNVTENL